MEAATTRAPGARPNTVLLALVVAGLALVYGPTVVWLFGRWTMSVWHNAHGLFIPPLVAWLVFQELRRHPELPVSASAWGFALLIPALALHVIDTGMQTQLLSAASIVIALPGLALLFVGWPRTRTILFPLFFTAFALPIPLSATEKLHLVLRHLTTAAVAPTLSGLGLSVFTEGTTLQLSNATVQIADACSGFSTLYAAMAFAFLLAYFTTSTTAADPGARPGGAGRDPVQHGAHGAAAAHRRVAGPLGTRHVHSSPVGPADVRAVAAAAALGGQRSRGAEAGRAGRVRPVAGT